MARLRQKNKQSLGRKAGRVMLVLLSLGLVLSNFGFLAVVQTAQAQESIKFSVTPPLFQINMSKGEQWASTIKVVNNNKEDLPVYTTVMNFEAQGEKGYGKFAPIIKTDPESAPQRLAYWVQVSADPVIVPGESSVTIPFAIKIPEDAPPGGHYAAIMVGNAPFGNEDQDSSIALSVSSLVTSLLFVRVQGEIDESGDIIDFYPDRKFYQEPKVNFNLRFENTGNVHLQPQGEIKITNMWGKDKGTIPINQKTNFGNVLRNSVRKFEYTWESENSLLEAGRYKALATLTFGYENRQTVSQEVTFWIVPLKPVLATLGGIIGGILLLIWGIRAFVKRLVARQTRLLGLPAVGLQTMPPNQEYYIQNNNGSPKEAYLIKRRSSGNNKTKTMDNNETNSRKVKRSKPAYLDDMPDAVPAGERRLKGMAWLKKEYQKQSKIAEQEIDTAVPKKKFTIKSLLMFKKGVEEAEVAATEKAKKSSNKKMEAPTAQVGEKTGLFKKAGLLLVASRKYVITALITAVIMGGVFGGINYFSAKDKDKPEIPAGDTSMKVESNVAEKSQQPVTTPPNEPVQEFIDLEQAVNSGSETTEPAETAEADVVIVEPEELAPPVDPASVSVAVYNGSGIAGLAGKYADLVEALGFNVADVGNADSFDYTISEINYVPDVESVREDISGVLSGPSKLQEQAEQDFDIILIIGQGEESN